jgi:hypothetical protein
MSTNGNATQVSIQTIKQLLHHKQLLLFSGPYVALYNVALTV